MRKKWIAGIAALALLLCVAVGGGNPEGIDNSSAELNSPPQETSISAEGSQEEGEEKESSGEDQGLNDADSKDDSSATTGTSAAKTEDTLTATFLDVGQGDCCIIRCGGKVMMVDGGPPKASSKVYSWLRSNEVDHIDVMVATHPDTDHTGGLSGALEYASCGQAYCSVKNASQEAFKDMKARLDRQGVKLQVPKVGSSWKLGDAIVEVIAGGGSGNSGSLMLQITHGKVVLLLTGDADNEEEAEAADRVKECDLLKVAHHGSASSSSYRFLRACMPKYAVISVGKNNGYGHPTEETLSKLRDCGAKVYRTDMQGNITATSNGKKLRVRAARNANADTLAELKSTSSSEESSSSSGYIGNANSHKFHKSSCRTLPEEKNRVYFKTKTQAVSAGYSPCGNCKP